jgi:putative ABC transport system permease protein
MSRASVIPAETRRRSLAGWILSDLLSAFQNLREQKTRTMLTGLGIVFGVGAVIGMLAIGAGARQESLRFIEELGVRNLLVQSRPASGPEEFRERRRNSPGLTERDVRILEANLEGLELVSARKSLHPSKVLPKPAHGVPELYGVRPSYGPIHSMKALEGRLLDEQDDMTSDAVCVLGEAAKVEVLGYGPAVGKYLKVNDTWLRVVGVLGKRFAASSQSSDAQSQGPNNVIYIPFNTYKYRFWDNNYFKDDLDAVDVQLKDGVDSVQAAKVMNAILNSTHRNTQDFTVVIPADLLAQQQKTQTIFTYVMVAIAAISLLVGGIGIMNIVLATVLERTHEIGIRRATGARRGDIVRQFLTESVLISIAGGVLGIGFGFLLSWLIARTAEWKTIVTTSSVVVAFGVSAAVGVVFGIYPAMKAARVDPIEALRYE